MILKRSRRSVLMLLLGLLVGRVAATAADAVFITEIMYHPPGTNLLEQWFELHNAGGEAANLGGWRITRGVEFTFPAAAALAAGDYLVVAADVGTFTARHPSVANVVGGWVGSLGHHLRLEDSQGQLVNEVEFHAEGDWAERRLGAAHFGHQGWEWHAEHDGAGNSLELVNLALPNAFAHNWSSSAASGGTPGRANSAARTNAAPFITAVTHRPIIPQPTDPVTVSARLVDEHPDGLSLTLHWRVDGVASFTAAAMFDDGAHDDGLAGDGLFGAILPPHANGTVVEFYLEARDREGNVRVYPAYVPPADSARTANLLCQVDNAVYAGAQPVYRLIMREIERAELYQLGRQFPDADSDAQMNATWITGDSVVADGTTTQLRYNVGVRNRGHGTRTANPNNYHVNVPSDRLWKGQAGINLNAHYAYSQVLGSAIFRRLGVPMADSRPVQVRVNSTNLMATVGNNSFGAYAANEQYNNDFVKRAWPLDAGGNSYRGIRGPTMASAAPEADLSWHGANFYASGAYTNAYFKQNNFLADDWSDLLKLIGVLNQTVGYSSPATYVEDVRRVVDVEQWMQYLAINTLLDNNETCLANGVGDDYALYRGAADRRFQALPYDLDTVLGRGLTTTPPADGIWRMNTLPVMDRFMKTPEFAPVYFQHLEALAATAFAPARLNPLLDQVLGNWVSQGVIDTMKGFNSNRVAYVLSLVPRALTVTHDLAMQSGYPHATNAVVPLHGAGNALLTSRVLVNGSPATWTAWLGQWTNLSVALHPGINRVLVQALDAGGTEVGRTNLEVWFDDGSVQTASGTIAANTTWTAAGGPYSVTSTLTINSGATLVIEPGTTVYLAAGVGVVVASGGRLLAEGTANAPIRFTAAPGSGASWSGFTIRGGAGSPETRIAYAHFEDNSTVCLEVAGGTLYLDHATFGTTTHQYVSLDDSSFILSHCHFPTGTGAFELVHGTGGIKAGGHGIVRDCFFGVTTGYNDVMDFTGGNRDLDQPIIQYYNNVFMGSSDDGLDLDGTDAWVEGNIFMHVHRNGAPDSSAAVSGGSTDFGAGGGGLRTSEVTLIGNLIFDCDNAATAKQGNFFTLLNNTIVHITKQGGVDFASGVVNVRDTTPDLTTFGRGFYLEGNIIVDAEQLVRNYDPAQGTVTLNRNLLPMPWAGPGTGNSTNDPLLVYLPKVTEAAFTTWEQAQVLRQWFSLRPGSPARGTGPNGGDLGGVIPQGVSLSGEPLGTTPETTATLTVGINRSGSGIPAAGFPRGTGFTHYKWRLDGGAWSAETPIASPIQFSGLANGQHQVEAIGKNDAGWYQDDPARGASAVVSTSRVWTVDTGFVPPNRPTVRLNEVLAKNLTTLTNLGATPDLIELYNEGSQPVDLSGLGLSDTSALPYRFTFPPGATLAAGAYLVVCADKTTGGPYWHTGFSLKPSGGGVWLFDAANRGGALLDSIRFGLQVADLSVGRLTDGTWGLCQPTFGAANLALRTGDPRALTINEWLTDAQFVARNDFVELYNPEPLPVALGGLFLSDAAGAPTRHALAPLSFIAAEGWAVFIADGQPEQGADHLNFKLSPDVGLILLSDAGLTTMDAINYGPQQTDVSQGRSPNGAETLTRFAQPTPGGGNPGARAGSATISTLSVPLLPLTATWRYNQTSGLDGIQWYLPSYNDSSWRAGPALLSVEDCNCLPAPGIKTPLTLGRTTYYFRTSFMVETNLDGFRLNLTTVLDDGAVVYLNGARLLTNGMSTGTPTYATLASRNVGNAAAEFFTAPVTGLVQGTNVLAAEVHQTGTTSSDITWGMAIEASRTITNYAAGALIPIVLNEVGARPAAPSPAFVELFNPSTNEVDLAGLSLTDDAAFSRKWVFPPGSTLGPAAHQVVSCDAAQAPSATNTGFGLNASGGAVFLFADAADNGALLDAVHYGLQTPGFSLARLPDGGGNWTLGVPTPAAPNTAAGLASVSALRVNEWMADPLGGPDWFEVYNGAGQPVALGGLFLTDDLANKTQSQIPPLSFIGAGGNGFAQFIADNGAGGGAEHVNFSLKKSGENLGLFSPIGTLLDGVVFGPQLAGVSEGRFPDGGASIVRFSATASPAESNYLPLTNAVINEVLTHTDPPLEDALELFNPTPTPVNLGGWYLSNAKENLKKYRIPAGTVLAGNGFAVFYEARFNGLGGVPFTFNSAHGDAAILSEADAGGNLTGYRSEVTFGAAENRVSFGRFPTSLGVDFTALSLHTFGHDAPATLEDFRAGTGLPNAYPKLGPVVISEIMYAPNNGGVESPDEEFLELENTSGAPVPLFDPLQPANTWRLREAVDFDFPGGVSLPPRGRLLVVGFDTADAARLAAFRAHYNVPGDVPILGPWNGRLENNGESIELVKPDAVQLPPHPDAGFVPQVLVDQVRYRPSVPWPDALANGLSLQRISLEDYGNEPLNWLAAAPTAGQANATPMLDTDHDGLPDGWEQQYFGNLSRDGKGDFDGDGQTDLQEYLAGTNPTDRADYLRFLSINTGNSVALQFVATAGRSYTVQYRDSLAGGGWRKLLDVAAGPVARLTAALDPAPANTARFYRLVTPAQP